MEKISTIDKLIDLTQDSEKVFSSLMPNLVNLLNCDRCFLYLRNPETKFGKTPFCWCRSEEIPDVTNTQLKQEPATLSQQDPLFAAALRTEPSIFVEDVETASPNVVNRDFEEKNFGHRALIHAHLCQDGQLWGVLQPCVFGQPRRWSESDRTLIEQVIQIITPVAITYVKSEFNC